MLEMLNNSFNTQCEEMNISARVLTLSSGRGTTSRLPLTGGLHAIVLQAGAGGESPSHGDVGLHPFRHGLFSGRVDLPIGRLLPSREGIPTLGS